MVFITHFLFIFAKAINKRNLAVTNTQQIDSFSKKIKEYRDEKHFSQAEFARKMNTHY